MYDVQSTSDTGSQVVRSNPGAWDFTIVVNAVMEDPRLSDRAARLYWALAAHASAPSGTERAVWPKRETLARRIGGKGVKTVDRALDELQAIGLVTIEAQYRDGARVSNRYVLHDHKWLGGGVSSDATPWSDVTPPPASDVTQRNENQLEREPLELLTPPVPSLRSVTTPPGGDTPDHAFQAFWAEYPRKVGKGQATKAWKAAVRRGVDPSVILTGLKAQLRTGHLTKGGPDYIPYPATWLNGERWADEQARPRGEGMPEYLREWLPK